MSFSASNQGDGQDRIAMSPAPAGDSGEQPFAVAGVNRVDWAAFQADSARLGQQLPDRAYVINLCDDRYAFATGFAAAMARRQIMLLPPDRSTRMLESIANDYPDVYCLTGPGTTATGRIPAYCIDDLMDAEPPPASAVSRVDPGVVAIPFTSGSTGQPQPHPKRWQHLQQSARLIAAAAAIRPGTALVATVPAQHMYGLELSVLLPLCCGAMLDAARPFFPLDIRDALLRHQGKRVLVTTPVHLRALLASGLTFPRLSGLISATAPLDPALAVEAERHFGAPLIEIYGCTEAGSLASRRPAGETEWTWFEGIRARTHDGLTEVEAEYLPGPVPLADVIEGVDSRHFRLLGRQADLINIAGKRSSLAALNRVLMGVDGVQDGSFFMPDEIDHSTVRLMALVVAPTVAADQVMATLRERLDPAFVPRSLYFVETLPRNEAGKLPRSALKTLVATLQARDPGRERKW
jgi:acyl-coenzyme A synthetase/AMP-(fatty) acid ligase